MNKIEIRTIFEKFEAIFLDFEVQQLTSGHINQTYKIRNQSKYYILQKVNTQIFKNLEGITQNIQVVAAHLKSKNYSNELMNPLKFKSGGYLEEGQWRLFDFLNNNQSFEKVNSPSQAFEAAKFLSEFHYYLSDLDCEQIQDSIPGFLDFNFRLQQFQTTLSKASQERLTDSKPEIDFVQSQIQILNNWNLIVEKMPKRLIHADPKISNFLFDKSAATKIKALIDWDTLMCGPILYDFGDMVRSYTNLKEEDDAEPGNNFSAENYKALKEGFLFYLESSLTQIEKDNLDLAAKAVILVQAIRFLTDYLNGDIYYKIHYPNQNLNRTKNQINLLKRILA